MTNKDKDKTKRRKGREKRERGPRTWMLGPLALVDEVGSVRLFFSFFSACFFAEGEKRCAH